MDKKKQEQQVSTEEIETDELEEEVKEEVIVTSDKQCPVIDCGRKFPNDE